MKTCTVQEWANQTNEACDKCPNIESCEHHNPPDVLIEVYGGIAEVTCCKKGITTRIIDHDNH